MAAPVEIRIHGRGGQGNVVAAYLLAAGAIHAGFEAQAFPSFGAERRGAPVTAFVRIRETPIRRRSEVEHPDFLVVQDAKLLNIPGTAAGLVPGGGILVNAESTDGLPSALLEAAKVVAIPASRLAKESLGRDIPNVPLIAALVGLTGLFPAEDFVAAVTARFDAKTAAKNRAAAEAALALITPGAWRRQPAKEVA